MKFSTAGLSRGRREALLDERSWVMSLCGWVSNAWAAGVPARRSSANAAAIRVQILGGMGRAWAGSGPAATLGFSALALRFTGARRERVSALLADVQGERIRRRGLATWVAALLAVLTLVSTAFAHVERPSYFPDPAPDTSVSPAAGGDVPKIRSLASSLKRSPPGNTRVVCQPGSLKRAVRSIRRAQRGGYALRPTDTRRMSARQARRPRD